MKKNVDFVKILVVIPENSVSKVQIKLFSRGRSQNLVFLHSETSFNSDDEVEERIERRFELVRDQQEEIDANIML